MAFTSSPNLNEVLVEDALSLFFRLELIELRERDILRFLLLYFRHIEVGLAVELGCLELLALLDVHASVHPGLGDYEVTGGLSTYPTCGHIGDFACRHQAVHILIEVDGGLVTVDGHALF